MKINAFYIAILLVIATLGYLVFNTSNNVDISFFGLAESQETEINYNYPVQIDHIKVKAGQRVTKGDTLLLISRIKSKETLQDQGFQIAELKARLANRKQAIKNEIVLLEKETSANSEKILADIDAIEKEINYRKSVAESIQTIPGDDAAYKPLQIELKKLREELVSQESIKTVKRTQLENDLKTEDAPDLEKIKRLEADLAFDQSQQVQHIVVLAPVSGLIDNISCKVGEHKSAFQTLLSLFEPHSNLIRGYIHEDMSLKVNVGDRFEVRSLKSDSIKYDASVTGLGSRIIEIPSRLRKIETIKSYGREILLEINSPNQFLLMEKVGLTNVVND